MKTRDLQPETRASGLRVLLPPLACRVADDAGSEGDVAPPSRRDSDGMLRTRVISLSGRARDRHVITAFQEECENALRFGHRRVMLNLARVSDADTRLVAALIAFARRARDARVPVELEPSAHVQRRLALCVWIRCGGSGVRADLKHWSPSGPSAGGRRALVPGRASAPTAAVSATGGWLVLAGPRPAGNITETST